MRNVSSSRLLNQHVITNTTKPSRGRLLISCSTFQHVGNNGFLPSESDPLTRLPSICQEYDDWENMLSNIPSWSAAAGRGELRAALTQLPDFSLDHILLDASLDEDTSRQLQWRVYSLLSFVSHAYMWCDGPDVPSILPSKLAVPWSRISQLLDMPPVLTYATYNLLNWKRLDSNQGIKLGNICCINNFLGGIDEEWFRLIHVEIEATAAPMIGSLPALDDALLLHSTNIDASEAALVYIKDILESMQASLGRMGEKCDPEIYFKRVRLPMSGWKNNTQLPLGLVYEGVDNNVTKQYYGETGAQSPILHALDALLGIHHSADSWLGQYLLEMRRHMPPVHRGFIASLEQSRNLRDAALVNKRLVEPYNAAVVELERFRSQHKAFAYNYISKFSKSSSGETGTGGSDFMPALTGYRDTTNKHLL